MKNSKVEEAQHKAHEFLLDHKLIKENDKNCLLLSFPNYWFYDILVALDYFRDINIKDSRLSKAIEILVMKQNADGTWNLQNKHSGATFFEMEKAGKPSKWNTLRGLRVLNWWIDNNLESNL
jgi:hypothetical protein